MKKISLIAATALLVSSTIVWAHGGAEGVVKERMDLMSDIGKDMKKIAAMVKGESEFDAKTIGASAKKIAEHAGEITELFPKGTTHKPSEALPAIWDQWERFSSLAKDLETEASSLSKVTEGGDKRAIMMQFAKTGKVCSTCHTDFRLKKD